ncbi:MAG TPA: cobalamin B12-binding domain-containing protein [Bacillota bacterium]|nr:cobalamin B12-binding domain-containing protein [Bacillota bacterium]
MDNKNYKEFLDLLVKEDKDKALLFILGLFENDMTVPDVYHDYLIPSLRDFECPEKDQAICIWKEHTRTSIIRTILESSYSYIIKQREKKIKKRILVVCPQEEYHEIGAIIANHYFSLVGFDSLYIGANTPNEEIVSAIKALKPDYVALSITNYYNLVVSKKLTEKIRKEMPEVKIILGGQATQKSDALHQVNYDYVLRTYEDILAFKNEVVK